MKRIGDLMAIKYKSLTRSLISGDELVQIIDLGLHGFADSFFRKEQEESAGQSAPLICMLDQGTGLVQLLNLTDPEQRYQEFEYSYTSSNSETARIHWENYILYANSLKTMTGTTVLELGSNDGFLLSIAKRFASDVLGVDASPAMASIATKLGIKTLVGAFGQSDSLSTKIKMEHAEFDFIFANNVLNHSNDPVSFVREVAELLSDDGVFIFEVPYWLESITSLRFDQIYHEHITYFTVKSSIALLATAGLSIQDVSVVDYHGGSLRVTASKKSESNSEMIHTLLGRESDERLCSPQRYEEYSKAISSRKDLFMEEVSLRKQQGMTIFGVGAAAKANTLLTYYGFTPKIMDFVLDSSPHKQDKLTPVSRIPIVNDETVVGMKSGLGIVLAWNLSQPIQKKLLSLNTDLEFINL